MIDESLLKSHFIGRDGFRWWIGQIPPIEGSQKEEFNGAGWGNRTKVRILGYHPYNEAELSNEDLPWAGILLPSTAGSGGSNYAQNSKLRPGDVVVGFFLDGDNGQLPMIMGTFGRTAEVSTGKYQSPFVPFTGYTDNIKNDGSNVVKNESNENRADSQKSPRALSQKQIDQLNQQKQNPDERTQSSAIGKKIIFADTCDDSFVGEVNGLLGNLFSSLNASTNFLQEVESTVVKIQSLANNLVGTLFNSLYNQLIPALNSGLNLLYDTVYAAVFAATPGDFSIKDQAGHLAGVTAQKAFGLPIKSVQDAMSCTSGSVVNGLGDMIRNLLEDTLLQIVNFGVCTAEQFVSSLVNGIINDIESGLSGVLGGVSRISSGFSVAGSLLSSVSSIQSIGGLFDCNQNNSKCKKLVKEWTIGYGPSGSFNINQVYQNVLDNMNTSSALSQLGEFVPSFSSPDCNVPSTCDSPTVSFFGGDGFDALGEVILGDFIGNTASIIGVQITNPGYGYYNAPPLVSFSDSCGLGYGAIGKAIVDYDRNSSTYGQVIGVYMISPGENYPIDISKDDQFIPDYGVIEVVIVSPGTGYTVGDTAIDNNGNTYNLNIDDGKITSARPINIIKTTNLPEITIETTTGIGAILKPIIKPLPTTTQGATLQGETLQGATPQGETLQGETTQGATTQGETTQRATPRGATPRVSTPQGEIETVIDCIT